MTIDFAFEIDQKVKTPVGDIGIITHLIIDNTRGKQVYVQTSTGGNWWREDQVEKGD